MVRRVRVADSPLLAAVVLDRDTLFSADAAVDLSFTWPVLTAAAAHFLSRWPEVRAVSAPMVSHGRVSGVLFLFGPDLHSEEVPAIRALADHLAVALENATLLRDLKQALLREHAAASELRRLEGLLAELTADNEPETVLRRVALATAEALGVERVALFLVEGSGSGFRLASSVGLGVDLLSVLTSEPITGSGGWLETVARGGDPTTGELREDGALLPLLQLPSGMSLRTLWAAPLQSRDGELLGVLAVFSDRQEGLQLEQKELAERYSHHAALAIASSRRHQRETDTARNQAVMDLARTIPHELGQPLAIISGYAELIAEGMLEGEALRDGCREIVEASGHLADIVQRLERITRYATKTFGDNRQVIDFDRAVQ